MCGIVLLVSDAHTLHARERERESCEKKKKKRERESGLLLRNLD